MGADPTADAAPDTTPVIEHRLRAVALVRGVLVLVVTVYLLTAGRNLVTSENLPLAVATVLATSAFTLSVPFWPVRGHRAVLDVSHPPNLILLCGR